MPLNSVRQTALLLCIAALLTARAADAQLIRGTARVADGARPIERARITAMLEDGRGVGETSTDEKGRFHLEVRARGEPFRVVVTRIGMKPTLSSTLYLGARDTLDVDFSVAEEAVETDTVRVNAAPTLNEVRLKEAERRGWRVFPPIEVQAIRERVNSFEDMLRSTGYPGFIIGRRDECLRSTRTNRCLLIVMDGMPLSGTYPNINPRDVYFLAVLSPNQAQVQFGDRAPNGALVVYTRSNGDSYERRK
jgi:hypothetical protein